MKKFLRDKELYKNALQIHEKEAMESKAELNALKAQLSKDSIDKFKLQLKEDKEKEIEELKSFVTLEAEILGESEMIRRITDKYEYEYEKRLKSHKDILKIKINHAEESMEFRTEAAASARITLIDIKKKN